MTKSGVDDRASDEPRSSVRRDVDLVALDLEVVAQAGRQVAVVFDDEDARHGSTARSGCACRVVDRPPVRPSTGHPVLVREARRARRRVQLDHDASRRPRRVFDPRVAAVQPRELANDVESDAAAGDGGVRVAVEPIERRPHALALAPGMPSPSSSTQTRTRSPRATSCRR